MIGRIGKEGCSGAATKKRVPAAVALGEDDLVEDKDGRVGGGFSFTFVDEFIETYN